MKDRKKERKYIKLFLDSILSIFVAYSKRDRVAFIEIGLKVGILGKYLKRIKKE